MCRQIHNIFTNNIKRQVDKPTNITIFKSLKLLSLRISTFMMLKTLIVFISD